jgi:hypothetical protein
MTLLSPSEKIQLALDQVQRYWAVDPRFVSRRQREVRARWAAAYALRVGCGLSMSDTARVLGTSTFVVHHACTKGVQIAKEEGWWPWLERLTNQLRGLGEG